MLSQELAQICLPFLFATQGTIGRSGFRQPVGCCTVVLSFSLIHNRFCLLSAGLDGPLGACCQGSVYYLLDHGMARVWFHCRDGIVNQLLVQEDIDLPL